MFWAEHRVVEVSQAHRRARVHRAVQHRQIVQVRHHVDVDTTAVACRLGKAGLERSVERAAVAYPYGPQRGQRLRFQRGQAVLP